MKNRVHWGSDKKDPGCTFLFHPVLLVLKWDIFIKLVTVPQIYKSIHRGENVEPIIGTVLVGVVP